MKARLVLALAVALGLALLHGSSSSADSPSPQWKELLRRSDLRVYEGRVADSKVYALRAEGTIDQPMERVAWVLLDMSRSAEWIDHLREDRVLRHLSATDYEEFVWLRLPRPLHDRETVTHVHLDVAPDGRSLTITARSTESPQVPPSHRVRAQLDYERIRLTALPGGKQTRLEVEVHIDPRGSLPAFVINDYQRHWPSTTFDALRRQAARPDLHPPAEFEPVLSKLRP